MKRIGTLYGVPVLEDPSLPEGTIASSTPCDDCGAPAYWVIADAVLRDTVLCDPCYTARGMSA